MNQPNKNISLDDKYTHLSGKVMVNGNQALVRALILQHELDSRSGLNTAGFVSGYRGSPIGGFDQQLWQSRKHLEKVQVVFQPGVNEELAATAVAGTQQLAVFGDARVDGVYGVWYGKGPGVDRAGDALKHGNYAGTHPQGGVLVAYGDDHPGKSSTVAHHSQQALASFSIPSLYPADASEITPYALFGWAMSRYAGCWVGLKLVNETIEQTMTVDFDSDAFRVDLPDKGQLPPEGLYYRGTFSTKLDEMLLRRFKMRLVQRFARANGIDRLGMGDTTARFGLVVAGKTWHDTRVALGMLGIDESRAKQLGIAIYKVGMIWPLEPEGLKQFAAGKSELFVIEEKTSFIEAQIAELLYNEAVRPRLNGKTDGEGAQLIPADVAVEPIELAQMIAGRLRANHIWDAALEQFTTSIGSTQNLLSAISAPADQQRIPFFCSGCPHNTSTKVPDGSKSMAGIGCHGMALYIRPNTMPPLQMGGEGLNWTGAYRFTGRKHMFQNMGDGTYYHSGLLAIRAAVASGANMTYKILYNDAVSMTGGQPVDGPISVSSIAHSVVAEGVKKLILMSDDPARHAATPLPPGTRIEPRERLDAVQRELRELPGVTVLLYEQTCAAEKRRRRKKGKFPDPDRRMFIYDAVCEGCGDCSTQSSCVSIEPKETLLGRKRHINQSTCNKDYSCVKGFCPSFVTVDGGKPKKPKAVATSADTFSAIPAPVPAEVGDQSFGIMIAGIGGTGVITVGAVLAMAAHIEGKAASVYDMTGLAQKNGAVYSHMQIASSTDRLGANRLGLGDADLVMGFDMVAALGDESFRTISGERSRFVGNDRVQPTAVFTLNPNARTDFSLLARRLAEKLPVERTVYADATGLALALCGDTIASNFFLVGFALQKGLLPVGLDAVLKAIELNGIQVEFNQRALSLGRLWAQNPAAVDLLLGDRKPSPDAPAPETLDEIVVRQMALLTDYQDATYAQRYQRLVDQVRSAEKRVSGSEGALSSAVARHFGKLMAYKDEYEVARLYSQPAFRQQLEAEFDGIKGLRLNLAPPLFSKRDPETGQLQKKEYGSWMLTAMGWLAKLRGLRGGPLDVFGRTEERRMERGLIDDYERRIGSLIGELDAQRLPLAIRIAEVPEQIRGFGHVKERHVALARSAWQHLDEEWTAAASAAASKAA